MTDEGRVTLRKGISIVISNNDVCKLSFYLQLVFTSVYKPNSVFLVSLFLNQV